LLFNSLVFALFLPFTFAVFWGLNRYSLKVQNFFLFIMSYLFYGWWDWRFLGLIIFSTVVDFIAGIMIDSSDDPRKRKIFLFVSMATNLTTLGFFKYYNFFIASLISGLQQVGINIDTWSLNIILPVGISFYTFQSMSYAIDIYRRELKATKDPVAFFTFVCFFPQLVAGPIERAANLLPQFYTKRVFNYEDAKHGLRQMLSGFMKKMIIADNLAPHVANIFNNWKDSDPITLFIGVFFFAFQIYCDFSGYSDIAVGLANLFGFKLMRNFAFPYFSRDIGEFWRRWHISLSTWFRDYVYIPLGGNKGSMAKKVRNVMITFTVSGLWHGANWTFVAWGFLNGLYLLPQSVSRKRKKQTEIIAAHSFFPRIGEFSRLLLTFALTLLAWVFFRANNMNHAIGYITSMFTAEFVYAINPAFYSGLIMCLILLAVEWIQRRRLHALDIHDLRVYFRWPIYLASVLAILVFAHFGEQTFIYFQF
jgi:alginate O-acetyltransferase complex protein AlgI